MFLDAEKIVVGKMKNKRNDNETSEDFQSAN